MRQAIGIDLGRSPVIGILTDINGRMLERSDIAIPMDAPFDYVLEDIKTIIRRLNRIEVTGICLGSPGWIDMERGICRFSPNYPMWKDVDLITGLKEEFKLPVFALNDVNAAALGEMYYGAGKVEMKSETPIYLTVSEGFLFDATSKKNESYRVDNMVFIAVGVGIGAGIVINGELVVGKNYGAGEVGHVTIEPDGPPCTCGNSGCLEALCSLNAIKRGVAEGLKRGWETSLTDYVKSADEVTFKIIQECARKNDELTMKILSIVGRYLGMGLAVVANVLDPELIVIGGDIVPLLDILHPLIMKELMNRIKMISYNKVSFVAANLGELSGAYGAAAYVFQRLYSI
ncbi:MAG: ROK family protein [Candidatus Eremiobacteraeota bacterium]|nr:ROK family protein [Candidatus Eremiobacteraeota bacterium]